MNDHYKTLQLNRNATASEIKSAYRKLAKKFHPDANPNNKKAEEVFKEISVAYSILSSEEKKSEYDYKMFGTGANATANKSYYSPNQATERAKKNMTAADFAGVSNSFESFFGFNPNSNSPELKTKNDKVKPMKTKDAFEAIFGKK